MPYVRSSTDLIGFYYSYDRSVRYTVQLASAIPDTNSFKAAGFTVEVLEDIEEKDLPPFGWLAVPSTQEGEILHVYGKTVENDLLVECIQLPYRPKTYLWSKEKVKADLLIINNNLRLMELANEENEKADRHTHSS